MKIDVIHEVSGGFSSQKKSRVSLWPWTLLSFGGGHRLGFSDSMEFRVHNGCAGPVTCRFSAHLCGPCWKPLIFWSQKGLAKNCRTMQQEKSASILVGFPYNQKIQEHIVTLPKNGMTRDWSGVCFHLRSWIWKKLCSESLAASSFTWGSGCKTVGRETAMSTTNGACGAQGRATRCGAIWSQRGHGKTEGGILGLDEGMETMKQNGHFFEEPGGLKESEGWQLAGHSRSARWNFRLKSIRVVVVEKGILSIAKVMIFGGSMILSMSAFWGVMWKFPRKWHLCDKNWKLKKCFRGKKALWQKREWFWDTFKWNQQTSREKIASIYF